MQLLAFKDPSGRVFLVDEIYALPPLAKGYEWTMVIQPDRDASPPASAAPSTEAPAAKAKNPATNDPPGIVAMALQWLTPRPGQTPEQRGAELIGHLPDDIRRDLATLLNAFTTVYGPLQQVQQKKQPTSLPPFPRG